MKIWTMSSRYVQNLDSWVCYCEENPAELINSEKYEDLLTEVLENLYQSYSWDQEPNWEEEYEDWNDWDEDDQCEVIYEFANDWKSNVGFEAYEVDAPEDFEILIDER